MKTKHWFWITVLLFVLALLPFFGFLLGLLLNFLFDCQLQDEGGTAYGDCASWQIDIVYTLTVGMWYSLMTLPTFGLAGLGTLIVTIVLWTRNKVRSKSEE